MGASLIVQAIAAAAIISEPSAEASGAAKKKMALILILAGQAGCRGRDRQSRAIAR